MAPLPRLVLKKNQDRRVRAGHPWIFSNEIERIEGAPADGGLVDVADVRGAFLGRGYYNRRSLISARLLTRGRDEIDLDFFVRRLERAIAYREAVAPGVEALRLVHGEADQLPGLVVDRYRDWLAVQVLTLGMESRADQLREAIERVIAPRGVVRIADSPLRRLEGLALERATWWGEVPERIEIVQEGFRLEVDPGHGQKTGLFLDQRENRRLAESRSAGRRVLDLFCYQGEWALHARAAEPRRCWRWTPRPRPWKRRDATPSAMAWRSASAFAKEIASTWFASWSGPGSDSEWSSWIRPRWSSHAARSPRAPAPTGS
jgi:23S rRNA (cytosine1962-C5)-methyltransferase